MLESKYEKQSVDRFTFIKEQNLTLMKNNNIKTLGELVKHSTTDLRNLGLDQAELQQINIELNLLSLELKSN